MTYIPLVRGKFNMFVSVCVFVLACTYVCVCVFVCVWSNFFLKLALSFSSGGQFGVSAGNNESLLRLY